MDITTAHNNLRRIRKERGLTQVQLSALADVAHSAISRIETGHSPGRRATLRCLATALGCSVEEVFPPS